MGPFSMVLGIVIAVMVARVLTERYRALGRVAEQERPAVQSIDTVRAQDEIRQLKDRVAVLERVITDNNRSIDLDREIERLRDR